MTRDEILNMPAGREMDALIENIIYKHSPYQDGLGIWRVEINDETGRVLPKYTTSIAAAWEVVDEMIKGKGHHFAIQMNESCGNSVGHLSFCEVLDSGEFGIRNIVTIENDAPLAICRAALLAFCVPDNA